MPTPLAVLRGRFFWMVLNTADLLLLVLSVYFRVRGLEYSSESRYCGAEPV